MPFDTTPSALTPWTTYADLTDDQRARFGGYVAAKDQARQAAAYSADLDARVDKALGKACGDTLAALGLLLAGQA